MTKEIEPLVADLSGHWNYRLVLMDVTHPDEPWYEIHEVFYDKDDNPSLWTDGVVKAVGETPQALMHSLLVMAADINRHPVLKESELPR